MTPDIPAVEVAIVEMTNLFRRSEKLGAVRRNPVLDRVAREYARYLAKTGTFSHRANGKGPAARAKAGGYRYCEVAENLALDGDSRGFETRQLARAAMEGWKKSPGHRRNLLGRYLTEIGVGVAKAPGKQTYLSVQLFGRPEALRFQFKIRNGTSFPVTYRYAGKSRELKPRVVLTYTVCRPGELTFGPDARRSQRPGLKFRFVTNAGDQFKLEPAGDSRFLVRHQPAVR